MSVYGPRDAGLSPDFSENRTQEETRGLLERKGRPGRLPPESSSIITRRITAVALIFGVIMATGKLWLFSLTGSVGILSSLVHSLLDMVAAASSFIAVRFAARAPTDTYRFGFGKAESFSAVFQVCLIGLAAFHLLGVALDALMGTGSTGAIPNGPDNGNFVEPYGTDRHAHDHASHGLGHFGHSHDIHDSNLAIMVMSGFAVLTCGLLIAQSWAIRATGSLAVRGDRAHYLADLLGNLFVISGLLISTLTDAHWADALVGIIMAFWLLYTAFRVARLAWMQLMDGELEPGERALIKERVMADPRIRAVTNLRTRAAGPHLHMQMQLDLDPHLSLEDSHDIVVAAEQRLMGAFPAADILIHPHPAGCATSHGNPRFTVQ